MEITNGTVALVTGGASGLGEATTRRLHAAGAAVVIVDLAGSGGTALAEELGERARFVAADVRDEDEVRTAVDAAASLGELRVVVCCAGVATPGRVVGSKGVHPLSRFRDVVDINLVGTFNVVRLAVERMNHLDPDAEGERGVIVMTASAAAFDGQIGQAAYSASKAGIAGMTLPIARDLAEARIRVMTIAPGTFDTPMLAGLPETARTSLAATVPHPARLGRPSEYAQLVEHVVVNAMLNGEVIRLDGALRMAPR